MSKGQRFRVTVGERVHEVEMADDGVLVDGERFAVVSLPGACARVTGPSGQSVLVHLDSAGVPEGASALGVALAVAVGSARARRETGSSARPEGTLRAPMPGRVIKVFATAGAACRRGDPLVVMEAMKMENELQSPTAGVIGRVHVAVGDTVDAGQVLCEIEPG